MFHVSIRRNMIFGQFFFFFWTYNMITSCLNLHHGGNASRKQVIYLSETDPVLLVLSAALNEKQISCHWECKLFFTSQDFFSFSESRIPISQSCDVLTRICILSDLTSSGFTQPPARSVFKKNIISFCWKSQTSPRSVSKEASSLN